MAMPHQITNRKRNYDRAASIGRSFLSEGLNALAYVAGGLIFLIGSIFFLPAFEQYAAAGAWMFIVGSVLYLAVTCSDFVENILHFRHHPPRSRKAFFEFGSSALYLIGSLIFVIGSVLFLPALELKSWGGGCFLVGSTIFVIAACINVTQITQAGSLATLQMLNITAICFVVGSVLFLVASVPYLWGGSGSIKTILLSYMGAQFVVGSFLFFTGGIVNAYRAYRVHQSHSSTGARKSGDERSSAETTTTR